MSADLRLDDLRPRMSPKQKLLTLFLVTLSVVILAASYVYTGIEPLKLYNKRGNAFEYLFGRQLSQMDLADADRQAKRVPSIIAQEEARQEIAKMTAKTSSLGMMERQQLIQKRAREILAGWPPGKAERIVKEEFDRIKDEKRGGFFPPETAWPNLVSYFMALVETIAIAIWGSLLATIIAIPVAMFAAENTLALMVQGEGRVQSAIRWFSRFVVRRVLDFCRGFNEFVMALIFVAVIGLGPFAGVLALAIHTFGILGKVFSEAIEAIEPGQVEAVQASGAAPTQIISFSVLPQVMPLIVSYSLLRFESNVRSATILGFCGAGGIGFLMFDKINGYLYREVCTMMIMVIVCVTVIDYLCGLLRKQFT